MDPHSGRGPARTQAPPSWSGTWWGSVWRGERSLAFVFWGLNVAVHVTVNTALAAVDAITAADAADPDAWRGPVDAVLAGVILLYVLWTIILIPVTWRTAGRYAGPKLWAVLARSWILAVPAVLIIGLFVPG